MTTATAIREEKTDTWSSMFPNEQLTQQQSTLFVKKLLAIAVSNITYLRSMFPEQAFGDRSLEDLNLKILRDDSSCPGACQIIQWLKGSFDALDKRYLEQLIIGIYTDPNDLNSIIESYTFKFSYIKDGIDIYRNEEKISGACTFNETKKATIQLLRTIIVLNQTLKPLPHDVWITVKLYYHDEITPPDYEPPGFKAATANSFQFEKEPINIRVGNVPTPFHMIKLRIKSDKNPFEENNPTLFDENAKENNLTLKDSVIYLEDKNDLFEAGDTVDVPKNEPNLPTSSKTVLDKSSKEPVEDKDLVCCPCGCDEDDGLMILCKNCRCWQHAVCFGILDANEAPLIHYCVSCSQSVNMNCTDPSLVTMTSSDLQTTCLWRRVLLFCLEENKFNIKSLAQKLGVENTVAHGFFNRLKMEGFIKPTQGKLKRNTKIVDVEKLQTKGIPQYFKKPNTDFSNQNTSDERMETSSIEPKLAQDQVSELTKQADSLSLMNKTSVKSEKENNENQVVGSPVKSERLTRRRKRSIISTTPASIEDFEISNSQDEIPGKRKKMSLSSKSILV